MTYDTLIAWFEDRFSDDPDTFIDNLDFDDIQDSIYDFGVRKGSGEAPRQLLPVANNQSNLADNILDKFTSKIQFINSVERKRDFDFYSNMIDNKVEPALARQFGINLAKEQIQGKSLEDFPPDAVDFLRDYAPQILGGFVRQEARRLKGG